MNLSRSRRYLTPGQILVIAFASTILAGALLLTFFGAAGGGGLPFIDALFTATSATCVTGLIVVDTGTALSPLGQAIVIALIQAGGLGIMTYASLFLLFMGRRFRFRDEEILADTLGEAGRASARAVVKRVLLFALGAELTGALILWPVFGRTMEPWPALGCALFHAISAFCNAGFSLFSDSLSGYRGDPVVNATIIALIVLGGLGFLVVFDCAAAARGRWRGERYRLGFHSRAILVMTGVLLLFGAVSVASLEWNNLLAPLPPWERFWTICFQAVTPRTAGFNTLDYSQMTDATLFVTILLMFVGASPGSTAGGIKTTTMAVVVGLFWSRLRGRGRVSFLERSVPEPVVSRAVSIFLLCVVFVVTMIFLLTIFETHLLPHRAEPGDRFLELMFEVVSAFGTVGLSTGVTAELGAAGKLLLILVMFAGRLGPLTLALALGRRTKRPAFDYAEENIMVG